MKEITEASALVGLLLATAVKNKTQQDVLKQPEANTDFFVIFFGSELL